MALENNSFINLTDVDLNFPLDDYSSKSLRKYLFSLFRSNEINLNRKTHNALKNISLNIKSGDRVGLIGDNGAGKTTLLRLLSGVYSPSNGKINIHGSIVSFIDLTMGMNLEASGRENIIIRGVIHGLDLKTIKSIEPDIINFSGLGEFIDRPIRTYSSGMLLRLGFSIITSIKSDIILMDEWLSTGDSDFQKKAEKRLSSLIDNSHILVMATHSEQIINDLCNKIIKLNSGEIEYIK